MSSNCPKFKYCVIIVMRIGCQKQKEIFFFFTFNYGTPRIYSSFQTVNAIEKKKDNSGAAVAD